MPTSTESPNTVILGKYHVVRPLGEGGMGQVFLAVEAGTGRKVVAKFMHRHLAVDPKVRQAFEHEAAAMMKFRHKNAVALLGAALDHDPPCLLLEYVPGTDLDKLAQKHGRFSAERVGKILAQLCPVLQAAHARGILHRDLTPVNIMVVDFDKPTETIKVMDFGLAKTGTIEISAEKLNGESSSIGGGTPDYVCPEQIRQGEVDGRGDLYSVGVMLYRLLTGHLPFENAQEVDDILTAHLEQTPPSFEEWGVDDVPIAIEKVVMRCLNKYPAERPAHARQLLEEYQKALGRGAVLFDEKAFEDDANSSALNSTPVFAPDLLIDRFEAWMPEQIAIMKLRGFVDGVGGQIIDSNSGVIRVKLHDNSEAIAGTRKKESKGWFRFFTQEKVDNTTVLELHLEKKQIGTRTMVDISVARQRTGSESRAEADACKKLCEKVCHELRAYLMIGR